MHLILNRNVPTLSYITKSPKSVNEKAPPQQHRKILTQIQKWK